MTDEVIIQELKKGNHAVLRHVYGHLDMITSYVLRNSGSEEDAHDLFQEGVIVFHRNAVKSEFQLSASIGTYLFSICKRMWYTKLKKKKKELTLINEYEESEIVNAFEFELPEVSSPELRIRLESLLDQLGENCKTILSMFYFQKQSLEKIKDQMGYNTSQVARQQKFRCLKKIREQLSKTEMNHLTQ